MSHTTQKALAASLKKLLAEKPLEKIAIKDITADSEVNRQTFYYHNKDVYDLIEWILITEGGKALGDYETYDSWQEGFLKIFNYMQENKLLVITAFHSIGREQLEQFIFTEILKLVYRLLNEQDICENLSGVDKSSMDDFCKYAFSGFIFQWIRTEMEEDPKYIVNRIDQLITRYLTGTCKI